MKNISKDQIQHCINKGMTFRQTATHLGISKKTLYNKCDDYCLDYPQWEKGYSTGKWENETIDFNDINSEGCKMLAGAIVERAVKDYEITYGLCKRKKLEETSLQVFRNFFKGDWFICLTSFLKDDVDGETVIRRVEEYGKS